MTPITSVPFRRVRVSACYTPNIDSPSGNPACPKIQRNDVAWIGRQSLADARLIKA
jgi:hypothetical protein